MIRKFQICIGSKYPRKRTRDGTNLTGNLAATLHVESDLDNHDLLLKLSASDDLPFRVTLKRFRLRLVVTIARHGESSDLDRLELDRLELDLLLEPAQDLRHVEALPVLLGRHDGLLLEGALLAVADGVLDVQALHVLGGVDVGLEDGVAHALC